MKAQRIPYIFLLTMLLFLLRNATVGQTNLPIECSFPSYVGEQEEAGEEEITAIQRGGKWMSAKDTLNVLVVFVQFPDDRFDTSYSPWPTNPSLQVYPGPTYLNTFIDSLPSQLTDNANLTHYFREMSFGRLTLTGKTRFVVTPNSRTWYRANNWTRWHINKEVLESLDATLDFAEFDRWKRYGPYDVRREEDGWVDDILVIYRNVAHDLGGNVKDTMLAMDFYGGEASLGYGSPTAFYVDNGLRRIGAGHPAVLSSYPGMGTTSVIAGSGDGWFGLVPHRVSIHELSHHWMTDGDDYGHNGAGFWAILNHYLFRHNAASVGCINSFERELLGWHYPDSIGTSGGSWSNLTLTDFISTNKSYKIKVPGGNPDEYFRLEYHQRISQFDTPEMHDASAKGLYIIHQSSAANPREDLRLQPADGRWTWTTPEVGYVSWHPNPLPIFRKTGIAMMIHGWFRSHGRFLHILRRQWKSFCGATERLMKSLRSP